MSATPLLSSAQNGSSLVSPSDNCESIVPVKIPEPREHKGEDIAASSTLRTANVNSEFITTVDEDLFKKWKAEESEVRFVASKVIDLGIYTGPMKDNKPHGKGYLKFFPNNKLGWLNYDGEFDNRDMHGFGILRSTEGYQHEGMWERNKRHGFARIVFKDGGIMAGQYQDNHSDRMELVADPALLGRCDGKHGRNPAGCCVIL